MRFVKLFQSLWTGSMRGMGATQHVFIYLLGNADENGVVDIHPSRIVDDTGLTDEQVVEALAELEAPDVESRTPDHEGRRIEKISDERTWGWIIVNYLKYRAMEDKERVREQTADRMKRLRERRRGVTQSDGRDGSVTKSDGIKKEKEKEKETENRQTHTGTASRSPRVTFKPPTRDEVKAYCLERRNRVDPELWYDHYESNGWKVGRNPMKSWKAAVRTWEKNGDDDPPPPVETVRVAGRRGPDPALEKAKRDREEWERENGLS